MISVPNHLLLSNGSKCIAFVIITFLLASCSSSKSASRGDRYKGPVVTKTTKPKNENKPKVDTVAWEVVPEEVEPPITDTPIEDLSLKKKSEYNLSLFLPISGRQQSRFEHYYGGVKMALELLESEGINLNVDVFDTKGSKSVFESQMKSLDNRFADVIIGPNDTDGVKAAAQYGMENEVLVVSPWKATTNIKGSNPYYLQFRPNRTTYFKKIVEVAARENDAEQIVILSKDPMDLRNEKARKNQKNRVAELQRYYREISGDQTSKLKTMYVSMDSLQLGTDVFLDYTQEDQETSFILWQYSMQNDESFVYNALRKLNAEKGLSKIHVYTMPIVLDSDRIGFDLYNSLDINICRSKFVNRNQIEVKTFERNFFNKYGAIPDNDAMEAYDLFVMLGRSLYEYGTDFQYHIEGNELKLLQSSFLLGRYVPMSSRSIDDNDLDNFRYFENKHLDMIEFKDNRLSRK